VAALAEGSIGQALGLAEAGGVELYRAIIKLLSQIPRIDVTGLYAFADQFSRVDTEDNYRTAGELLLQVLARMIVYEAGGGLGAVDLLAEEAAAVQHLTVRANPAQWAALRDRIGQDFFNTDLLNLDRKQTILGAFFAIEDLAR
jgi:DNA polymerase-3 subunit delta'